MRVLKLMPISDSLLMVHCSVSLFLDVEASVDHEDVESSNWEDNPTHLLHLWRKIDGAGLLERARAHDLIWVFWMSPQNFGSYRASPGWEDYVVFHIGRCAQQEQGVKAAFVMPLVEKQVWLEANMSMSLKNWLVDIPGVICRNQQVLLHAISPKESQHMLSSTVTPPSIPGSWVEVRHDQLKGNVGMAGRLYPWGCKVLLVPRLCHRAREDQLTHQLFNPTAVNATKKR
ncbi:uncharacterized protein EV420DRAFT_1487611 [Desarmillaria tabescens]|uniref:Uncharacterized protein n=1 Tax=Armillaria tabescens TaxID=1929756 RepID=A0AA39MIK0_ARMTA|nr:uncharacterized protein EV420DRAFT_1487611 [Desarmillaria tabescens]KAK0436186.1 hypothetical protein EV420DRAFT_1487611 [Desarmillaria tabescens]